MSKTGKKMLNSCQFFLINFLFSTGLWTFSPQSNNLLKLKLFLMSRFQRSGGQDRKYPPTPEREDSRAILLHVIKCCCWLLSNKHDECLQLPDVSLHCDFPL